MLESAKSSFKDSKAASFATRLLKLPISRDNFIALCIINGPLFIALLAVKFYKLIFALWPVTLNTLGWQKPTLWQGLYDHKTIRIFLFVSFLFFCYRRIEKKHYLSTAFLILGLSGLGFMVIFLNFVLRKHGALHAFMPFIKEKFNLYAAEIYIFRTDIAFIILLSIFTLILLKITPKSWKSALTWVLLFINALLLSLVGIELAHYLETGVTVSSGQLFYFFRNAFNAEFWYLIGDVGHQKTFIPIFVTLLVGCLSFLGIRLAVNRLNSGSNYAENKTVITGLFIWPFLALNFYLPNTANTEGDRYLRFNSNIFMMIGQTILAKPLLEASRNMDTVAGELGNFDTSHLKLKTTSRTRPLNVVIIMLESVRAQSTSVYNPKLNTTPFLKELSQKSLVVESMHASVPRTSAAWVSVLQGIYPSTDDVLGNWANEQAKVNTTASLPRLLKEVGYRSAFFVPSHLEYENEGQMIKNMAFDHVVSKGDYDAGDFESLDHLGHEDRVMLKPILSWVDDQKKDKANFLLTIMTYVGHAPYHLPSKWKKEDFIGGENEDLNNYLNCISYSDNFLKQLFDGFSKRGLFDSTIFFILGDHGEAFYEHGINERASCPYEEALHIPMLVFAPSLYPNGGRVTGFRGQIDIIPTVTDMLGYSLDGGKLPGLSLLEKSPADRTIYFSGFMDQLHLGMLRGTKKFIYSYDRIPMEVYDLAVDPMERHDIAKGISKAQINSAETDMLTWSEQVRESQSVVPTSLVTAQKTK